MTIKIIDNQHDQHDRHNQQGDQKADFGLTAPIWVFNSEYSECSVNKKYMVHKCKKHINKIVEITKEAALPLSMAALMWLIMALF